LVSVAIVSQIVTISSIVAVVAGILNGFLSVKVRHKTLLLGALCIAVGAIGCFFAPNLLFMAIFYPFDGVGTILVGSMAFTLIGESLPLEKRAKSVAIVTAAGIFSSAIGFGLAGYIAIVGGWRSYLLWYILPISLIAIGLAYLSIPSKQITGQTSMEKTSFLSSFKEVLINKSASACLIGYTLMGIAAMWAFFAASFWINQFNIEIQYVGLISLVTIIVHALGNIIGGRIVDSFGRKDCNHFLDSKRVIGCIDCHHAKFLVRLCGDLHIHVRWRHSSNIGSLSKS
jgi:DHA1 family bicyclomycin/chloramphenicol resistance-like MFS transporter